MLAMPAGELNAGPSGHCTDAAARASSGHGQKALSGIYTGRCMQIWEASSATLNRAGLQNERLASARHVQVPLQNTNAAETAHLTCGPYQSLPDRYLDAGTAKQTETHLKPQPSTRSVTVAISRPKRRSGLSLPNRSRASL